MTLRLILAMSVVLVAGVARAQDEHQTQSRQLTMTVTSRGGAGTDPSTAQGTGLQYVSMDFQDANLKDVLKVFSQQTGINVIAGEEIATKTVTLYLEEVTALDALDQILSAAGLVYERAPGSQIYVVKPKPSAEAPKTVLETRVYRLRFARVSTSRLAKAVEALGSVTPFEAQQLTAIGLTGTAGGVSTSRTGGTGASGTSGTTSGTGGGTSAPEIGIDRVIARLLTDEGRVIVDERTNSLVVTDVPDNFLRIEAILKALDVQTAQILIEAELLETTLTKLKDLGVEWGTGSSGTILTVSPAQRATKFPFFNLEDKQTFLTRPSAPAFTTGGQIVSGVIDASQINMVLQALEKDSDTKILARPKVLTLDNESAVIRLTSQQAVAIQSITVSESGNILKTPERMTTGVILVVTPQINEDGYVTMLVEPSVIKTVASAIASDVVDPKARSARALVRIRHGETLVLGGLIDRSESQTLRRVPILSGIPLVGEAFKNKQIDDTASELIVFVTPRILSEAPGTRVAAAGLAPAAGREQERRSSRQELIEQTLNRLEHPPL